MNTENTENNHEPQIENVDLKPVASDTNGAADIVRQQQEFLDKAVQDAHDWKAWQTEQHNKRMREILTNKNNPSLSISILETMNDFFKNFPERILGNVKTTGLGAISVILPAALAMFGVQLSPEWQTILNNAFLVIIAVIARNDVPMAIGIGINIIVQIAAQAGVHLAPEAQAWILTWLNSVTGIAALDQRKSGLDPAKETPNANATITE